MQILEKGNNPLLPPDVGWLRVMEYCSSPEALQDDEKYVYRELRALLLRSLSTKEVIDPTRLCAYLAKCHKLVEAMLKVSASYYSKLQWLWYLRRLPLIIFEGELSTSLGYDSTLAETLSAITGRHEVNAQRVGPVLQYDVNRSIMRRVLRFAYGVRFLSNIQSAYRRAGKSQDFEFQPDDPLPQFEQSGDTEEAIRIYDDRMAAEGKSSSEVAPVGWTACSYS
jgi:hypothetical protein